jgi:hypothetical protein
VARLPDSSGGGIASVSSSLGAMLHLDEHLGIVQLHHLRRDCVPEPRPAPPMNVVSGAAEQLARCAVLGLPLPHSAMTV